jgi:hypothetical protein
MLCAYIDSARIEGHKYGRISDFRVQMGRNRDHNMLNRVKVIWKDILTPGTSQHAESCCQLSARPKVVTGAHELSCLKHHFQ